MFSQPAYTRRQFLGRSMTVVSTAATVPAFVHRSVLAFGDPAEVGLAARPGFPDDRILVVVEFPTRILGNFWMMNKKNL